MNDTNITIEQFLTWFADQEDIPLQTRRDFFAHVKEIGGLDQKAMDYLDTAVAQIKAKSEKRASVIKEKLDLVSKALDNQAKVKELSLVERIISDVSQWFNDKVDTFKSKKQAKELAVMHAAEDSEHDLELDQVAALKAAL